MNFFEQELRRFTGKDTAFKLSKPLYAGRACFIQLSGNRRARLEFVTCGTVWPHIWIYREKAEWYVAPTGLEIKTIATAPIPKTSDPPDDGSVAGAETRLGASREPCS